VVHEVRVLELSPQFGELVLALDLGVLVVPQKLLFKLLFLGLDLVQLRGQHLLGGTCIAGFVG
jgi:hypothetical protein